MRHYGKPAIRLSIPAPPRPRERGATGGDSPPGSPVDMHSVKGILREYDRGAYGEAFRGDRLAKIAVLGKGEFRRVIRDIFFGNLYLVSVFFFHGSFALVSAAMYSSSIYLWQQLCDSTERAQRWTRPGVVAWSVCGGLVCCSGSYLLLAWLCVGTSDIMRREEDSTSSS